MYNFEPDGVHAEVLDFPGVLSCGKDLDEARHMLSSALVDMAETCLIHGRALPVPQPDLTNTDADLAEPIHLLLTASSFVEIRPGNAA